MDKKLAWYEKEHAVRTKRYPVKLTILHCKCFLEMLDKLIL